MPSSRARAGPPPAARLDRDAFFLSFSSPSRWAAAEPLTRRHRPESFREAPPGAFLARFEVGVGRLDLGLDLLEIGALI